MLDFPIVKNLPGNQEISQGIPWDGVGVHVGKISMLGKSSIASSANGILQFLHGPFAIAMLNIKQSMIVSILIVVFQFMNHQ